jgi:glutamate--cysteine ligase
VTTDLGRASGNRSRPVGSVEELVDFLRQGEKPPEQWRVGTEHEKIGLHAKSHAPVP